MKIMKSIANKKLLLKYIDAQQDDPQFWNCLKRLSSLVSNKSKTIQTVPSNPMELSEYYQKIFKLYCYSYS